MVPAKRRLASLEMTTRLVVMAQIRWAFRA
jgi:hypothetical protein